MNAKMVSVATVILLLGLTSNSSAVVIAHWALDETTGTTAADSVGGNDGTLQGDLTFDSGSPNGYGTVPGKFGNALEGFSGSDYVDVGNVLNPGTSDYSVTLWFKPTQLRGTSFLASKGNETTAVPGWGFYHSSAKYFDARSAVGPDNRRRHRSHASGNNLNIGQWYHLALTLDYDPAVPDPAGDPNNPNHWNMVSYLDGNPLPIRNVDETMVGAITGPESMYFGRRVSSGSSMQSEGALDDIGIFNEALTQSQIQNIMINGVPEPSTIVLLLFGLTSALVFRRYRRSK